MSAPALLRPDGAAAAPVIPTEETFHRVHPARGFFRTYVWSHDHKMIGPSTSSPASSSWP